MLLVGDIGGTKTDLAIFPTDGVLHPQIQNTFKSANYPSLEAVIQEFLAETKSLVGTKHTISKAVLGVAGPVVNGESQITNLPWHISEKKLCETLGIPIVKLLNDLEAIAHAVPHLSPQDLETLNEGQIGTFAGQHKAVVAPGTGLGEAILFHYDGTYHVQPSEGGHTDFAPTNLFEMGLLNHLLTKYSHVSYERVCSGGMGIPNIYGYLKQNHYAPESSVITQAIQEASDPTPLIVQAGLKEECELCQAALTAFVRILGAEASNLALTAMALGGIYLGGGIPPRIVPKLKDGTFMAAFLNKGRFADTVARIPVHVILNKQPALLGTAHHALTL